ncbi:hypothetical protein ADICEAN_02493 [Cesiribacter andamanensis AMV16]|uniref:Outer membrane protein beta-barrel domain-containing protein n=2 Tax=Cesiribacter TaxID=1133570 RepID=M7N596_9BACT|nr:hypothetical protein ADICEAN_02493 [Cesiribacter andamanensis AMV16]
MGYAVGASVGRALGSRLQLEGSLSLLKLRENVAYTYTDGTVTTLERSLNSQGQLEARPVYATQQRQLVSAYTYGSLQLGTTYFFWQGARRRFHLSAGAGANLLLRGRTELYQNGAWVQTLRFPSADNLLEQSNYDLMLGAGYNQMLFGSYELSLMPTLNYYLGSTYQAREPFGLRSYTLGIKLQLRRRFHYTPLFAGYP